MINTSMLAPQYTDYSSHFAGFGGIGSAKPASGGADYNDVITKHLGNNAKPTISDIKWAMHRFPELKYYIGALATFTAFTNQYPWVNKNVLGPGGISVLVSPRLNQNDLLIDVVNAAFQAVKESGLNEESLKRVSKLVEESIDPSTLDDQVQGDLVVIKELAHKLLKFNNIYSQLYKAATSIITYSSCVVDYSDNYSTITFYSLDDLEFQHSGQAINSTNKSEWIVKKTKLSLSPRAQVITDDEMTEYSPIGRVVNYLKIIDTLEISISVERLAKSNSFVVWKVGVDGMPGELVTPWLDVYKERVMNRLKAGTNNGNVVQAAMSKSLTASHVFVPNFKESPTSLEKIDLQYRPLLDDLKYWWSKTFMAIGIPPYYSSLSEGQNISKDITSFHEGLMGSRVRMYQSLLEKTLTYWIGKFVSTVMGEDLINKYDTLVNLPTYVSGGEEGRSEYMRRVNQFASAYSTLSVSGLPISPDFAVKLMFPNADPTEVVDWRVRNLMNPQASGSTELPPGTSPAEEEAYVDSVLDTMTRGVVNEGAGGKAARETSEEFLKRKSEQDAYEGYEE